MVGVLGLERVELDGSLKSVQNLRSSSMCCVLCWILPLLFSRGLAGLSVLSFDRISFTSTVNRGVGPGALGVTIVTEEVSK